MTDQDDMIHRLPTVLQKTGLSRSTLYRKIGDGTFPRQIKISQHCASWRSSAIDDRLRTPSSFRWMILHRGIDDSPSPSRCDSDGVSKTIHSPRQRCRNGSRRPP